VLNWLASQTRRVHAQWYEDEHTAEKVEQSWRRIAEAGAPHILLADLPQGRGANVSDRRGQLEKLAPLAPPKQIDAGWRIGSFSALASGAVHETAASDHDARAQQVDSAPPPDLPPHDILRFPRGPSAGDCVHATFERADFTQPSTWDGAIQRALALHPQRGDASSAALPRKMLRGLLQQVVSTPLADGVVLDQVPANRRLNELGFHLPAANLSPSRLNAWLAANGYSTPRLGFEALRGYLHGFIDLTFESGGRFYVLDWKSNHLGYAREDYGAEGVAGAMREHSYALQSAFYSIAVHRYLGRRVAGYHYERHFGGVLYLFVRGVRPKWLDANGAPLGVWFHRPAEKTLASLDALLAAKSPAKAA
jgi:exodeoxyribonuclease V beta subunit